MERDPKTEHMAAAMLDALSAWILREAAEFPIRSAFLDRRLKRATDAAEARALNEYSSTGSSKLGLEAGKNAFKRDFVGSYPSSRLIDLDESSRAPEHLFERSLQSALSVKDRSTFKLS